MEKQRLFQFAVIFNPTKEQAEKGEKAKIVVELQTILARDEKEVQMKAAKAIPVEYDEKLSQLEVAVRPF